MKKSKYTKEQLEIAIKNASCLSDVCRALKGPYFHGTSHNHMRMLINRFGLDTSHFLSKSDILKQRSKSNNRIRRAKELLVLNRGYIAHAHQIRRALTEIGREYKCELCDNRGIWNTAPITLEIDHKNGNKKDDRSKNLRYLCPNCHSQTKNFKSKNRRDKA